MKAHFFPKGAVSIAFSFLVADSKPQTIGAPYEEISLIACSESTDCFSTIVPHHFVYAPDGSGPGYFSTSQLRFVFTLNVTYCDVIVDHKDIIPSINITRAYNNSKYGYMPF